MEMGQPLVHRVVALARKAGQTVLAYYRLPDPGREYTDGRPVSAADRASHRILRRGLARLTPYIPVVSEQGRIPPYRVRKSWNRFWLVDPLDGTREFLSGIDEFTVNVALVVRGDPVLGVIYAPALDVLYYADPLGGAWRQEGGAPPVRIFARERRGGDRLVVVESRAHTTALLAGYLRTLPVARRIPMGSSLKFCRVAEGEADLYPRLSPTMEWDVAAGDCIYRHASRLGRNRSPLRYNKPDLRNESFVIGA